MRWFWKQKEGVMNDSTKGSKYLQMVKLNGQPLFYPWFTNTDLLNCAKVELETGAYPNKK